MRRIKNPTEHAVQPDDGSKASLLVRSLDFDRDDKAPPRFVTSLTEPNGSA
jgi:hypothetical protein